MCCPDSENEVLHKQTEKIYWEERFLCCSDDPKILEINVHIFASNIEIWKEYLQAFYLLTNASVE